MKKVVDVNISNVIFPMEVDAEKMLATYLHKLEKKISGKKALKEDILAEIEKKISKKLHAAQASPSIAITTHHIQSVIDKLGSPSKIYEVHSVIHKIISHHKEHQRLNKAERIISKSLSTIDRFFGVILLTIGVVTLLFITLTLFTLNSQSTSPILTTPLSLLSDTYQLPALILLYLLAAIPMIFFILAGISMARRKSVFSPMLTGFMLSIWVILIAMGSIFAAQVTHRYNTSLENEPSFFRINRSESAIIELEATPEVLDTEDEDIEIEEEL